MGRGYSMIVALHNVRASLLKIWMYEDVIQRGGSINLRILFLSQHAELESTPGRETSTRLTPYTGLRGG